MGISTSTTIHTHVVDFNWISISFICFIFMYVYSSLLFKLVSTPHFSNPYFVVLIFCTIKTTNICFVQESKLRCIYILIFQFLKQKLYTLIGLFVSLSLFFYILYNNTLEMETNSGSWKEIRIANAFHIILKRDY